MTGYVRPKLTDSQARMLQLATARELDRLPGRTLEAAMLRRADAAIDAAFERREERRARRASPRPTRRQWIAQRWADLGARMTTRGTG